LQGRGDLVSAERAYRQAAESDDREIASVAMVNLATIVMGRNDPLARAGLADIQQRRRS
jgi:hypothetical protein